MSWKCSGLWKNGKQVQKCGRLVSQIIDFGVGAPQMGGCKKHMKHYRRAYKNGKIKAYKR